MGPILGRVRAPSILRRHRGLRWFAPVAVVALAALGGLAVDGAFTARASSETLPETSPAALIAGIDSAKVSGFSGTIVARMSLGLPDVGSLGGAADGSSMTALLSGSHTLRFWYGGPQRQRLALLGATSETDLFRSGNDVWQWDSATREAVHTKLPAEQRRQVPAPKASLAALSPLELAQRMLAALDPSTEVSAAPGQEVADRRTYDLVLRPRDDATRVGSVRISVDAAKELPLAVRVYARGQSTASIDVAFSSVTFKTPASSYFEFSPPPGAKVHVEPAAPQPGISLTGPRLIIEGRTSAVPSELRTSGKGWTTIVEYRTGGRSLRSAAGAVLDKLPEVSGTWGSGRLLESPLLCVLATDDGRVYAGSVDPVALYAAAAAGR